MSRFYVGSARMFWVFVAAYLGSLGLIALIAFIVVKVARLAWGS